MESISTAIAKIKVSEETAAAIRSKFEPFELQAKEWEEKARALVVNDASEVDKMNDAREARLSLRRIRLAVTNLHSELKEDSLRKGQLLDMIKRTLVGLIEPLEAHLQTQEDFTKVQEEKERANRYAERLEQIKPYRVDGDSLETLQLGDMPAAAFESLLLGLRAAHEHKQKEREDAERARQENERKAQEERARMVEENERLKEYNSRALRLTNIGFKYKDTGFEHEGICYGLTNESIKKMTEKDFDTLAMDLAGMVDKYNAIQEKHRKAQEAKLAKERAERQRLEKEQREREAREESARKEKAAAERKAKRAPDKTKLLNLAERIELIEQPEGLKDDEAKKIFENAQALLAKVVKYIRSNAENL